MYRRNWPEHWWLLRQWKEQWKEAKMSISESSHWGQDSYLQIHKRLSGGEASTLVLYDI